MKSKRYKKLPEKTFNLPSESIEKLISDVKKNCTTKFDESVDLSFQINTNKRKVKLILEQLLIYQVELEKKSKLQLYVKSQSLLRQNQLVLI